MGCRKFLSRAELARGPFPGRERIRLPNDKKLVMQINSLRYQVSKTGNLLFESPEKEGVHDDYLWALALVFIEVRKPD